MATFKITAPMQQVWNAQRRCYEPSRSFTSRDLPLKSVFGVVIEDGQGETDDPLKAVELFDCGYKVEPDPHPAAQEIAARRRAELEAQDAAVKARRAEVGEVGELSADEQALIEQFRKKKAADARAALDEGDAAASRSKSKR